MSIFLIPCKLLNITKKIHIVQRLFSNSLPIITCILVIVVISTTSDVEQAALNPKKGESDPSALDYMKSYSEKEPEILKDVSAPLNSSATVKNEIPSKDTHESTQINKIEETIVLNEDRDSGALYRFFLVSIGICTLTVLYVSYRFYRTRTNTTRPTAVRKYGVLTQRTDIEMLPLPLDDEEDDDTVFDVGNHVSNR
ncbi:hypothetical protein Trydic_g9400 [Trypoxylus dichotomus]